MLKPNSLKSIFVQIAEWTEDEILAGRLNAGDRIYSQNEYAAFFNISVVTASRASEVLDQRGLVVKQRGIGMFVADDAYIKIEKFRRNGSLIEIVDDMIAEGDKLGVSEAELISIISDRRKCAKCK